jgi:hypothetical protein
MSIIFLSPISYFRRLSFLTHLTNIKSPNERKKLIKNHFEKYERVFVWNKCVWKGKCWTE